jgi:alanine or glycine:cation symporter, AGCS family
MLRTLWLMLFVLLAAPAHAQEADATEAEEASAFDAVDAAFGKWLVGPMAKVMFFDVVLWDNSLPAGVVPEGPDGGPFLVDGAEIIEANDDGYVVVARRSGAVSDAELVLAEPQARVQGSVPVVYRSDDSGIIAEVKGGPLPLGACAAAAECGSSLAGYAAMERSGDTVRLEAGGGKVEVVVSAEQIDKARVLTDRAPFPVVAIVNDKEELELLAARVPVPDGLFPIEVGSTVRLGDTTGEVVSMEDASLTIRASERSTIEGPLANPADVNVPLVVAWLVLGAVYFTLRMGLINLRGFGHAIAVTMGRYDNPDDVGEISHFKALSSALSATVGLGNIAGVAIAVAVGGPGAIPWMILAGFLGMSSKFTECTLGQMYRTTDAKGNISGGPFRYLHEGLKEKGLGPLGRVLSVVFALMCIGGSLGGGNMFQANQSYEIVAETVTGLYPQIGDFSAAYGIILALAVGVVILGGIKRIGAAAGFIVPIMCGVYVLAALYIIGVHVDQVPEAFGVMWRGAFSMEAGLGGLIGALIQGFRRAAFSNEAGVGSASIAHSAAATDEPVREGIVALLEPFIDTIVVCTMTGLVVVITGAYLGEGSNGVLMTSAAFGSVLSWFPYVLTFAVVMFAFSTMISWSYYGERCATFLFGPGASVPYKLVFLLCAFFGSVFKLGNVLDFSDLMILGMAFPNILGLFILSGDVKKRLDDYWGRLKSGEMKPVVK